MASTALMEARRSLGIGWAIGFFVGRGYFYCRPRVGGSMPSCGERNRQWGRGFCGVGWVVGG